MKKRIVTLIMTVALILSVFCGCKSVSDNSATGNKKQITLDAKVQVIADSINIWKFDKTAYEGQDAKYEYCITDLDQNGRRELITVVEVAKSGVYGVCDTTIKYYELNEDMTALLTLECVSERTSQPDVRQIIDTVNATDSDVCYCYKDSATGRCYYIYSDKSVEFNDDGTKNEHTSKVAISIYDGKAYEETLATYSVIREKGKDTVELYTDYDGNEITADDFNDIANIRFKDYEKTKVTFGWQGCSESNFDKELNPNDIIFKQKLAKSYNIFIAE